MHPKILEIVEKQNLVSVMSNAKWTRLANALMDLEEKEPFVRIRDIYDEEEPKGFSLFDWTFSEYSSERLIWVDISPIRKVYRGGFVKDEIVDNTEYVLAALLSAKIPFSMSGINYRVWGYYEAGKMPEFL